MRYQNFAHYSGQKNGYTLIELLVVISIMGLLTSVVLASLREVRVKARDAKRIADLHQIHKILELYNSDHGHYPYTAGVGSGIISSNEAGWADLGGMLDPGTTPLPVDPLNQTSTLQPWQTGNYVYTYFFSSVNPYEYDLIAQFEDTEHTNRCELKCWKTHIDWTAASFVYVPSFFENIISFAGAQLLLPQFTPNVPWCNACAGGFGGSPYIYTGR